ncbi:MULTISPECIES: GlxA family transcriptional regulator [Streptomycetaceae]|nr:MULTISPECIES: helix-turn-helix domain-containing protein [Streptomycetaceae]CCB75081.1 putative AraC-family transcriptional regulator [Streptantibioticus cattleyicolor NRRL 8057 = DSM 46488]
MTVIDAQSMTGTVAPGPAPASDGATTHTPRSSGLDWERPQRLADGTPVHRVAVLVQDGVIPFELGIPARILGGSRTEHGEDLYSVRTCAPRPGPVHTDADFTIDVRYGLESLALADTVVVPSAHEAGPVYEEGRLTRELRDALAAIRPGTRMVSICTGSYVLAAAGLLDGRPATTHWKRTDHFQRLFPRVRVDPDVLFVDDGDVLTSAGVAAGVDLCLHLVRRDHGASVANSIARRTVVPPHRDGGQAQYVLRPVPDAQVATTATAREWAQDHLEEPITLRDLADQESMSVRTFTRRFREETGVSPGQWLTRQRVERARQLLESTELTVDQVARSAGFGTAASLRQHLQAALGVSPTAYRRTFRTPAAG